MILLTHHLDLDLKGKLFAIASGHLGQGLRVVPLGVDQKTVAIEDDMRDRMELRGLNDGRHLDPDQVDKLWLAIGVK